MKVIHGIERLDEALRHPVVTIGNFDGVHLGHRQIIDLAIKKAKARSGISVVFTFRPHPQIALRPESKTQLLSTYEEKIDLIGALGVDYLIEQPFSREFSVTPPEVFFTDVILRRISAEEVVVGYDFAFGKERKGSLESLEALTRSAGIELSIVPAHKIGGEVVSSSRIRQHLMSGEMESAARLLGRSFSYRGVVLKGDGRGKKIGFATANLKLENKIAVPFGVYATLSTIRGREFKSVTNVGVRPTFMGADFPAVIETHIMDFDENLYGETMEVKFIARLRAEKKFSGVEELKTQIARDVIEARESLEKPHKR